MSFTSLLTTFRQRYDAVEFITRLFRRRELKAQISSSRSLEAEDLPSPAPTSRFSSDSIDVQKQRPLSVHLTRLSCAFS